MQVFEAGVGRRGVTENSAPQILLVEDDAEISTLISSFLRQYGFQVAVAVDGREADRILAAQQIDILALDIMLPGEDGLSLCRRIRANSNVPILILTALGSETDRIVGLEAGADDYISKPFNQHELLARIRAILRRNEGMQPARQRTMVLRFEGWKIDLGRRQLYAPDGARVQLTAMAFDLLVAFCQHPRQVLTRNSLQELLTGGRAQIGRNIDIQVSRLRKKIESNPRDPTLIKTVRSGGYFFTAEVTSR